MTAEYAAAIVAHDVAIAKFIAARDAYRAKRICDAEFLYAKKEYDTATKLFDAAFAKEAELRDINNAME